MSTKSKTLFIEEGKVIANMYRHWDGYPTVHGEELARFLDGMRMVNGLSLNPGHVANGMGCLAAQVVAHLKKEPGDIYLLAPDDKMWGVDYVYKVFDVDGEIHVHVDQGSVVLFEGTPRELLEWLEAVA